MNKPTNQNIPRSWIWQGLKHILPPDPIEALKLLLDAWDVLSRWWAERRYRGMYEILDYDATLELLDRSGAEATFMRREVIHFLQDNIVAIHDHAWGDGQIFAGYRCQPGVPVDFYADGSKHNVLISLRETKNAGDVIELWIERRVKDGFMDAEEWLETEVDHLMKKLRLSIIFPQTRPCRRATLSRRSSPEVIALAQNHLALLPDGRQKLTWCTGTPKLHERYTIKWVW